jgi:hypothetical protein
LIWRGNSAREVSNNILVFALDIGYRWLAACHEYFVAMNRLKHVTSDSCDVKSVADLRAPVKFSARRLPFMRAAGLGFRLRKQVIHDFGRALEPDRNGRRRFSHTVACLFSACQK